MHDIKEIKNWLVLDICSFSWAGWQKTCLYHTMCFLTCTPALGLTWTIKKCQQIIFDQDVINCLLKSCVKFPFQRVEQQTTKTTNNFNANSPLNLHLLLNLWPWSSQGDLLIPVGMLRPFLGSKKLKHFFIKYHDFDSVDCVLMEQNYRGKTAGSLVWIKIGDPIILSHDTLP